MYKIVLIYKGFALTKNIQVFENNNCIENISVRNSNILNTIIELYNKYPNSVIHLCGNGYFLSSFKDKIKQHIEIEDTNIYIN